MGTGLPVAAAWRFAPNIVDVNAVHLTAGCTPEDKIRRHIDKEEAPVQADMASTGNVVALYGTVVKVAGVQNEDLGMGKRTTHMLEFHPDNVSDVLLHVRFSSALDDNDWGWTSRHLSHRFPIPGGQADL